MTTGYVQRPAAQAHQTTIPDSLKKYTSQQLLEKAEKFYDSDLVLSLHYARASAFQAEQLSDTTFLIRAEIHIARTLRRLGNFTTALEYALQAFSSLEKVQDTATLIQSHLAIGNIYSSLHNYTEAGRHFIKALRLAEKTNDQALANCLGFLGINYVRIGLYDSALHFLQKSREVELKKPQPGFALLYTYNYLGEAYTALHRWEEALYYFSLANSLAEERKNAFGQTFTYLGLAQLYLNQGKNNKAREFAQKAIALAEQHHFRDRARLGYEILYKSFEADNDFVNAYKYHRKYDELTDSIFSEDKLNYIAALRLKFETEKIERENELLRKNMELEQSRYRSRIITLISISIALISVLGGVYLWQAIRRQRQRVMEITKAFRKGIESTVKARTRELDRENQQLQQFNYIIAHNLKSPIARMRGLISLVTLQHGKSEELEKLELSIQELEQTVTDLMDIIRLKSLPPESHRPIVFRELLQKVTSQLQDKLDEAGAQLTTNLQVNECSTVPAYLESIMFNLISNSIKYRSARRTLKINVETKKENGYCQIIVSDNGSGFDASSVKEKLFQPYQRFHNEVEGKGLGLFMVKTQVEALGGYLEVDSKPDEGATFHVYLPVSDSHA
ncbi:MAG: tetratricopeptide repeat-containing sensor histidine kinase [Cyclobacteriaceae bacterium]|nr:tetratricopeptide repeat-containing sensor histidine kinase [Cyclobacteriaceae bacterium]